MSDEKLHRHPFHHQKEEKPAEEMTRKDYEKQVKHHKHLQHVNKLGSVAAASIALHEKHMAKKDPENAHSHKIKEEIAATIAVGSFGFPTMRSMRRKMLKKKKNQFSGRDTIRSDQCPIYL